MKFWQNVSHVYILEAKKFQVWKIDNKPKLESFGKKSGQSGKIKIFFSWGFQIFKYLEFKFFNILLHLPLFIWNTLYLKLRSISN